MESDNKIKHFDDMGTLTWKRFVEGPQSGFSGSRIWLISRPGYGILKERGTRFGIVIMTGTRDLAILIGGNREMSL